MSTYTYTNGNYSSSTTSVNGVSITQNILNLGGSGCDSSSSYCQEGYSLYVPCLKNITRGQNVCFQMYVSDIENQDALDLSKLEGLSLELSGVFGCPYKTYTWPDDITSLQTEKIKDKGCISFNNRETYKLDVLYRDTEFNEIEPSITGKVGYFYGGDVTTLRAYDTPTHIFVGWLSLDSISDDCDNYDLDDLYTSKDREITLTIDSDITLYAIYRVRNEYNIKINFKNRHSYFLVTFDEKTTMLSDKVNDYATVKEGYHFVVECCPNVVSDVKDESIEYTYNFISWSDGHIYPKREYFVEDSLFTNGEMLLLTNCTNDKILVEDSVNISNELEPTIDDFIIQYPEDNILVKEKEETEIELNDYITDFTNVNQVYFQNDGWINITNGDISLKLGSVDTNLRIIVNLYENEISEGVITLTNEDNIQSVDIEDGTYQYILDFENCESETFILSTDSTINIKSICILEVILVNKGLIELCVPPEDTSNFYTGVLNVSGVIGVNGNQYGIDKTQLGTVNKLSPIIIKTDN
jgi:hypothetical protein